MDKKPKDYLLAERGYNAFHNQQPQMWFDDLSHDYQMKWVRAAREIIALHDQYKRGPNKRTAGHIKDGKLFKGSEEQRRIWREAAERKRKGAT
jgi:hypothetical protein